MTKIRKGDTVRAHLDASFKGIVVDVVSEKPTEGCGSGPLSYETFCYVEIQPGKIVKRKVTDLYIEY